MVTTAGSSLAPKPHGMIGIRILRTRMTAAFRYLAREKTFQHRKVYASGISTGWLRCYAIESAKHIDDY